MGARIEVTQLWLQGCGVIHPNAQRQIMLYAIRQRYCEHILAIILLACYFCFLFCHLCDGNEIRIARNLFNSEQTIFASAVQWILNYFWTVRWLKFKVRLYRTVAMWRLCISVSTDVGSLGAGAVELARVRVAGVG